MENDRKLPMRQKIVEIIVGIIEKIIEIIIFLAGDAVKNVLLLLAFEFYAEGERLGMWIQIIGGYICQMIFYKLFLVPYISPVPDKDCRNENE